MSRANRPGGTYIQPLKTDGTSLANEAPRGTYTLSASTTYYFPLGGADAPFHSVQITGYTSGLVITSATIQDTNHDSLEVVDHSSVAGEWITEDPTTAFVGVDGTGWSQTNGVVAASGGGVGGALWHLGEAGAMRARLAVVVGGTGGLLRVSCWGKD
jgi:hypothetical protein